MKFNFNTNPATEYMVESKQIPTISQDGHGAWWVHFHRLGPGAVQGPLANQGYALRTVQRAFPDEVEFTPEEQAMIDMLPK